jgi:exonuclease VII small subunit
LLLCSAALLAQKKEGDVVQTRDGKSQTITIEAENWDALVAKGSAPIAWQDVQSIEYAGGAQFEKAVEAFKAGNHAAASTQFAMLKRDAKLRKIFQQTIAFDSAYATELDGKLEEAIAAYQDVMKKFPKGRYHVQAAERLCASLIASKNADGALPAIDAAIADVSGEPGLSAALGLIRARILVSQNKSADAKLLFGAAASAQGVPSWVVFEGQLGQAAAMQSEGNKAGAKTKFQALTKADANTHVLAGAWNGLGDISSEEGRTKKDIDQLVDSLYMYLRGCTVYAPVAGDPTDQYERSLAGSARCFGYIADLEPNKDKKNDYKRRAAERMAQLKQEFPNSPYLEGAAPPPAKEGAAPPAK